MLSILMLFFNYIVTFYRRCAYNKILSNYPSPSSHARPDIFVLHVISNLRNKACNSFSGHWLKMIPKQMQTVTGLRMIVALFVMFTVYVVHCICIWILLTTLSTGLWACSANASRACFIAQFWFAVIKYLTGFVADILT